MSGATLPPAKKKRHVHLKVADLKKAAQFYHELMGFNLIVDMSGHGRLSAGGYHHHIGLNTWESKDGPPPAPRTTGLYHFAINYPARRDLATALRLLEQRNGASTAGRTMARTRPSRP